MDISLNFNKPGKPVIDFCGQRGYLIKIEGNPGFNYYRRISFDFFVPEKDYKERYGFRVVGFVDEEGKFTQP
jgi:hypothetical protein